MNSIRLGLAAALVASGLVAGIMTGCASGRRGPGRGPAAEPVPEKRGEARFFDGQVTAIVDLGPGAQPGGPGQPRGSGGEGLPDGGRLGGPPGERAGMGGGMSGMGGSGGPPDGAGGPPERMRGGGRSGGPGAGGGLNFPPARIVLTLANATSAETAVTVGAFDSRLGNFAVQPEVMNLPANGRVASEPMTSRLGVGAGEISITVTLVRGSRKETQTVILRDTGTPPPRPIP